MTKIAVITSFNDTYYNKLGKYCVSSWLAKWPENMSFTCYVEDCELEPNPRIHQVPFSELGQSYIDFQKSNENNRTKLFAKKGYSIIHAMENIECDLLIWIDADVMTHRAPDMSLIESLCNANTLATVMGVLHYRERDNPNSQLMYSCESSFFILNKRHPKFNEFAARYRQYYDEHLAENLRRLYDGEVLGATVKEFDTGTNINDLNRARYHKTPMPRTVLNNFFVHLKASLKDQADLDNAIEKIIGPTTVIPLV